MSLVSHSKIYELYLLVGISNLHLEINCISQYTFQIRATIYFHFNA